MHDKVLEFIDDRRSAEFDALALEVFVHQYERIPVYRRVCAQRGRTPQTVSTWRLIPPVPVQAFQHVELCCAPAQRTFLTTGTSRGPERRGRHALPDLRLYRAAACRGLKEFVFPDVVEMRILSLIPSVTEHPESSLAQMVAWAVDAFGREDSVCCVTAMGVDFDRLAAALHDSERDGAPVCIMATTATLMRFLDRCGDEGRTFRLPHGSRLMDTGGNKGAPRVLSRNGLLRAIWNVLAIPGYFVTNEYGMTELSSQLYDNVIRERSRGHTAPRAKVGPHWLRTLVLDPRRLCEVREGEPGLLCHIDLANAGTAVAVLTEDIGRVTKAGLELIGRVAGAEARGCSLAVADFVAR